MMDNLQPVPFLKPSSHNSHERPSSDEIDLLELTVRLIRTAVRYKKLIAIVCVSCLALGAGYFTANKPVYKSEMIVLVPWLKHNEMTHMLKALNHDLEHNIQIQGFDVEAQNALRRVSSNSSATADEHSYTIEVSVANEALLPAVQQNIIQYISNNEFVASRTEAERQKLMNSIALLENEQFKMSQIQDEYSSDISKFSGDQLRIADISRLKVELQKEQIHLQSQLNVLKSVAVIQNFSPGLKPTSQLLLVVVGISILASVILASVLIIAFELSRAVRKQNSIYVAKG